jgi:hypothetical protein
MTIRSRVFSVLLWTLTAFVLTLGVLGTISATELLRFATISDDSSSPTVPNGSLELAMRVPTKEIAVGDVLLVGAHSAQGSTLGEVIDVAKDDSGVAITLKGTNRAVPDQWSYELGATTYKHVVAIPFIGHLYALASTFLNPWVFGALMAALVIVLLSVARANWFAKAAPTGDRWFKKLDDSDDDNVDEMLSYFAVPGEDAPQPYVKKKRRWSKR